MSHVRVLVVDDSVTMRALFSGVLEKADGIDVVGHAGDADEAREQIIALKPDVMTLDVEMPGMSGLEFLEEVMRDRPMPVVMLSTLTQKGASASLRALELGAVECFPKPTQATLEEFALLAPKLTALVRAAAAGRVPSGERRRTVKAAEEQFDWNGRIVAISAATGGVDALLQIMPEFPANCPPTLIVMPLDPDFIDPFVARLNDATKASVQLAQDGLALLQGHIYVAADPRFHIVVDRWPDASMRLIASDPVAGSRPSASLLFATLAKTARADAVGVLLTGMGTDGVAGLKALRAAGGGAIVQDPATAMMREAPAAAVAAGAAGQIVALDTVGAVLLGECRRAQAAA
ncbi:chemotaxis-specific protein-glutamate methyltransferase CheB [Sphingomonas sp. KC8]|uniref:chemotaxis-specific protein-glutamate methyltransferase CheB n=1 Tax=Sphingomonas sp. KC8 TaxID=1030157 RepID=UPI0002D852E0|nr:chemotaxis-specific protein-glutamate methyltransferase CheB [Sphingomonas sp. KC8]ARS26615.1 transcriptional regulator [Sphingomonas sp. KC8]